MDTFRAEEFFIGEEDEVRMLFLKPDDFCDCFVWGCTFVEDEAVADDCLRF